jgi:hypothetical protein
MSRERLTPLFSTLSWIEAMCLQPAARAAFFISLIVLGPSVAVPALAASPNGIPLCTAAGGQLLPVVVADGAGGVIVAWHDNRATAAAGGVCYAQRIDANGTVLWAADGIPLSTTGDPGTPAIAADGAGGAFVTFAGENSAPRVQWVDAAGVVQWGADGIAVGTSTTTRELAITRDIGGGGGAIIAWRETNGAGGSSDIIAQRVSSTGVLQWNVAGKPVSNNTFGETLPALVSDHAGGCWVAWMDANSGPKVVRLNANGDALTNRVPLGSTASSRVPTIVSDGANGAVVAWSGGGAWAQRVTSDGSRAWTNSGVQLSDDGARPSLIADGNGGAIIAWEDNRSGTNFNVYAQHVSGAGATQWAQDGAEVCFESDDQRFPLIVSDGGTGAIVTWQDERSNFTLTDIHAQRIDANGAQQWTANGVGLCTAAGEQERPVIASDGSGGAWVAWQDGRNGAGNEDIYVLRFNPNGVVLSVPWELRTASIVRMWPNPFSHRVAMELALASAATVRLEIFDVRGRMVHRSAATSLPGGRHTFAWDGLADDGSRAGEGIYFMRVSGPGISLSQSVVLMQ